MNRKILIMGCMCSNSTTQHAKILLLGLDRAGKTTFFSAIKGNNDLNNSIIGCNVMTVDSVEGVVFELWDVGVTENTRNRLVHHYSENTKGLVYVVDSNDVEGIKESRTDLLNLLKYEEMKGVPIVVIANKQDLPNALTTTDLTDLMDLHTLTSHKWYIQAACAITGIGVFEAMKQMAKMIKRSK